jgi:anti-anti-sigma regulatory factor
MNLSKLTIRPNPSPEKLVQQFVLIGTVDVEAVETLQTLYILPPSCSVELDFAQVDRVNSMGLAQLLKLFERWQNCDSSIRVINVNRMIGVLFKMTGLNHFLADEPSGNAVAAKAPPPPAAPDEAKITHAAPAPAATGSLSDPTALQIQPLPSGTSPVQHFSLLGNIDVNAVTILETLYVVPEQCAVTLDFAQLQRVNSMGLAQLLKLFQHWQARRITISIINVNRMIGVLFKMTGLTGYLSDAPIPTPVGAVAIPNVPTLSPARPATDAPIPTPARASQTHTRTDKLSLWVSAQSSQQMNGWYFFNTYLQRQLGREVHLEISHGAMTERRNRAEDMDIVFTKPFDATRLMLQHDYRPLLRPIDQTDEVTLLVRSNDIRQTLAEFKGGKIVTAAPDNFVYLLGRFLLEADEDTPTDMDYVFSGHDIKALQMLLKGSADILFMLSDTYRGLSGLTRKMLREIDQSETAFAFHLFCVAPHCTELGDALADVLLNMGMDSQGRQVLADLGIPGWVKPTPDECDMLSMLFKRYAILPASL